MLYSDDELFDILNEDGSRTGTVVTRGEAHRTGALHGSVHIWVVRGRLDGIEVLLQRRAKDKDSFPDCYDAASTGHINAGEDCLSAAVREIGEGTGISAKPAELILLEKRRVSEDNVFHGKRFINNEITWVYLYRGEVRENELCHEQTEISALEWFSGEALQAAMKENDPRFCIDPKELELVLSCFRDID